MEFNAESDADNKAFSLRMSQIYDESGKPRQRERDKFDPVLNQLERCLEERGKAWDGIRLLDVGIGYGTFLSLCGERGVEQLYGMDPFPNSIELAKSKCSAEFKEGRIEDFDWPFPSGGFDVVSCNDVVEHLEEPATFFERCRSMLNEDGLVVVRTPNGGFPYKLRRFPLLGIPDTNPTHINVHAPAYWRRLAVEYNFRIITEWVGEELTHIRWIYWLGKLLQKAGLDHRRIPVVKAFEQAHVMIMAPK